MEQEFEFNLNEIKREFESLGKWRLFIKNIHMDSSKMSGMTSDLAFHGIEFSVIDIGVGSFVPYDKAEGYDELAKVAKKYGMGWHKEKEGKEELHKYFYFI